VKGRMGVKISAMHVSYMVELTYLGDGLAPGYR
jgi:hypothetical protein